MNILEKIIAEIDDYLYEKYCIEGEDGISKIIYSHIDEMTVEHNEGGYVFIADKDFLDKQKAVSKEFLQECKEVADKYRKGNKNDDWIPVTERLPEYGADVLCTEKYTQKIYIGWCDNIRRVGVRWFDSEDFSMEVVAWMPLPEPYKAE